MGINVIGSYPKLTRFLSGLTSLDMALQSPSGEWGLPLRSVYEIYGYPGVGKSSLSYYLAGKTAGLMKDARIDLCDLEILDPDYVVASLEHAGFSGTLNFIGSSTDEKKPKRRSHEEMVQELQRNLELDEVACGVLDSIGAIVPIAEDEGEIGEANMGRRAKLVAQFSRKTILTLRDLLYPKNVYIVNHVLSVIGGRGHTTPGGESVKYLGAIRIMVNQDEVITNSKGDTLAFVARGRVEKLRYGSKGREFRYVVIPGYGVSRELSAVIDCVELGLATRKTVVKLGTENMGYITKLVESAQGGYNKTFQPFFDALDEYKVKVENQITPEETDSYDEPDQIDIRPPSQDEMDD